MPESNTAITKQCRICRLVQTIDCFTKHATCLDGYRSECKKCKATHSSQWYYKNQDQVKTKRSSREFKDAANQRSREKYKQDPTPIRSKNKEWRQANPKKKKNSALKLAFGIDMEQWEKMLQSQNGVCAICHGPPPSDRSYAVDHCHATGKVRGLLCGNCNKGLGNFKDSIKLMELAIKYLLTNG